MTSATRPSAATVEEGAAGDAGRPAEVPTSRRALLVLERYALPLLLVGVLLFFSLWSQTSSTFTSLQNIQNVLGNQAVLGVLAMAVMVPLVCGHFDFAVGSLAGLAQVATAAAMSRHHAPLVLALAVGVGLAALVAINNGVSVARIGVNSLIVTLGTVGILTGLTNWYTEGQSIISGLSTTLTDLGSGNWLGIPRTVYVLALVAGAVYYLLEHTPFGRYLHSVGSNADAARLVGLRVDRLVMTSFLISGVLAGIAGVLLVARNGNASPQVGTVYDTLQALAAAFLGATAIRPGRFNVPGTLLAIFFLAFTVNGLQLAGVAGWVNDVFNGAALFIAVVISTVLGRRRAAG